MENEATWRAIPGFEGYYEVSSLGDIRSVERIVSNNGRHHRRKSVVLRGGTLKVKGRPTYRLVTLSKEGVHTSRTYHQLVCEAFHGPRPVGLQAAHLNGDSFDNRAENLAWVTAKENSSHRRAHGTDKIGVDHHAAKLDYDKVRAIRGLIAGGGSIAKIARAFCVATSTIHGIKRGVTWRMVR